MNFSGEMYKSINLFLESLKTSEYVDNTIVSYELHLRNLYSYCKQLKIDYKKITVKQMLEYKIIISKSYAFSSVNAKISVIKSFYNFLIDIEEVTFNPIRDSMYIRKDRKNPRPLSQDYQDLFYNYIDTKEKHIELGFKLLFDTGIRISELVKLEKSDIKVIDNRVYLLIRHTKNKRDRLVPVFSQDLIDDLFKYLEGNFSQSIFLVTKRAFQLHAENFAKKFDIDFSVHMTRHTFATRKLNEDMRLDILQKILGHADIKTTMYYAVTEESEILKLGGFYETK